MKYYATLITISLTVLILQSCVPVSTSGYYVNKTLLYQDHDYEKFVGVVQVYPESAGVYAAMENPTFKLGQTQGIEVVFDFLEENYSPVSLKLIHCNMDWKRSGLADIRFLDEYNSFNVTNYQYSSNTREPYVRYSTVLPVPKISGNYLLVAFNNNNENDVIFSRRILVFESATAIDAEIQMSAGVARRRENQQVRFDLSYSGISNVNPLSDLRVLILQNHHWASAKADLKPTLVRADQSFLEYHHLNGENEFDGGNEYRFFDLRSVDYRGMNVSHVAKEEDRVMAFVSRDKPRGPQAYSQLNQDINGNYYLGNTDPGDTPLNSEYVQVYLELETEKLNGPIFICGRFNNWIKSTENQMKYDEQRQSYRGKVQLKQGYYNYAYQSIDPQTQTYLEGNFFQTRNDYEILVYYRNPTRNYDELVGYQKISSNF